jgi:hypothetical protein
MYMTQIMHHQLVQVTQTTCFLGVDGCPSLTTSLEHMSVTLSDNIIAPWTIKNMYLICYLSKG